MCGITGFIDGSSTQNNAELKRVVEHMSNAQHHRGPDSHGAWVDEQSGIALGHRRLAIIDLSEEGAQPRRSEDGRYILTYNGEIYNYRALKKRLTDTGRKFHGESDTEVLLVAIEEWGLEKALHELNGMFAFALWDKKEQMLHLARDRIGEKPLYYGRMGKYFLFGSELKSLRAHPSFVPDIDRDALAAYTRHNYVPAPWSIYKGIFKLPPGAFLSVPLRSADQPEPKTYWNIKAVAEKGAAAPLDIAYEEAVNQLDTLLGNAVNDRMMSDVPLGAFLSGGIDSSLVTALMQKNAPRPVQSFCIGFEETGYNEAQDAKNIAKHLGTNHTEFYVTAEEARNVIPDLPDIYDEPFADPSQIPTYHVSRLARQKVTVALSGDGGDESFAGYSRYAMASTLSNNIFKIPQPLRTGLAAASEKLPLRGRARKLSEVIDAHDDDALYRLLMSYWKAPENIVKNGREPLVAMTNPDQKPNLSHYTDRMMYADMIAYLPDDILCKLDRASMAVSLETRVPLLDYKVIEYAWQLPLGMKIQNGKGKVILRSLLERYVPKPLFDRPKQGFAIPHGQWLRGPLREWAEALLDEKRLEQEGFFHPAPIRKKWAQHLSGKQDWGYQIWGILMFQSWYEKQKL